MFMKKTTLNSIFSEYGSAYIKEHNPDFYSQKVIRAISDCRTEALGGHIQKCDSCGHEIILYNSCRNRHCPQCQFIKKEQWVEKKKSDVLPFQYFHTVFTIPEELNPIVVRNKELVYKLMFDATKETLLTIAEDDKYFGAKIGFFSILHTWGQKLNLHPHIHTVVPGGGFIESKKKWISAPANYLVPVKVVMPRFRSIFLTKLKQLRNEKKLNLKNTDFDSVKGFQGLINKLFEKDWVVYIKESFKNSDSVIEYLSKYTHRIAISNYRIVSCADGIVSFKYRDYVDDNKEKVMKLPVLKFIKRFITHIVPKRFVRIRYYGLLSNSTAKNRINDCREYYNLEKKKYQKNTWHELYALISGNDPNLCSCCSNGNLKSYGFIGNKAREGPSCINS